MSKKQAKSEPDVHTDYSELEAHGSAYVVGQNCAAILEVKPPNGAPCFQRIIFENGDELDIFNASRLVGKGR